MTNQERAEKISELIGSRLGVRGKNLHQKLHRAGRLLPKFIRGKAQTLVDAAEFQASPKLSRMIDQSAVNEAFRACEKHLLGVNSWDRRKGKLIGFLSTNVMNLLVISAMVIAVLAWRGFI